MARGAWIAIGLAAALWATAPACRADDDPQDSEAAVDPSPGVTTIDELLAATSRPELRFAPTVFATASDVVDTPNLAIDLVDNSMLGRLQRERSLSFLTLSSQRRSRLFLGVNEDGFVGLHFKGTSAAPAKVRRLRRLDAETN